MAKQPETLFKEKVRRDLETLEAVWVCKTQQVSIRGTLDFLCCVAGHFVALELKRDPSAKVTKLQLWNLEKIQDALGYAYLVDPTNWKEIFEFLKQLTLGAHRD